MTQFITYLSRCDPRFWTLQWHMNVMNSLPSLLAIMIKGLHSFPLANAIRGVRSFPLLSRRPNTMSSDKDDSDPFSSFLDPNLRSNPRQFVKTYFQLAKSSDNPLHALWGWHMVEIIGVNKATATPKHESFTIQVVDKDMADAVHMFLMDRMASTRSVTNDETFDYFTQCPDSKTVLESIQQALKDMSTMAAEATNNASTSLRAFAQRQPFTSSQTPILPLTNDHASSSDPTSTPTFISWSLTNAVAMARSSARSSSLELEAEDMISGVKKQDLGKSIRQYKPDGLSMWDVVLIAYVVHKLAPTYALFRSQCYWFANVIFEVIVALFPSKSESETPPPGSPPTLLLPNDYLPKEAGRWCGILINDPRVVEAVVSIAKCRFKTQQANYLAKVNLYYVWVYAC